MDRDSLCTKPINETSMVIEILIEINEQIDRKRSRDEHLKTSLHTKLVTLLMSLLNCHYCLCGKMISVYFSFLSFSLYCNDFELLIIKNKANKKIHEQI